ncbi:MAG TPA: T9SS type A sorting domain-containing protein [Chitinophagaceae bacterium]|nr:T9SS type A sorting domain-containing protein [Chitinophagaceae bacterium]
MKLLNTNSTNNQAIFNSKESASNRSQLVIIHSGSSFMRTVDPFEIKNQQTGIMIYPNPAKGSFIVQNYSGTTTLKLYDLSGRLVKQLPLGSNGLKQIPVGNLRNGLYLIRIENEKGVITKKILIEN